MVNNEDIKEFIRKTLGCTCPDEVFQSIECQTGLFIEDNLVLDYEINVGNKLLIYVIKVDDTGSLGSMLSRLVRSGIQTRDKNKFNRFRLVLITETPTVLAKESQEIFKSLVHTDEKVHLHVIDTKDFPVALG